MNIDASDRWIITDRAGNEIAVVSGATYSEAAENAAKRADVRAARDRDGGFGMRRLRAVEWATRSAERPAEIL